MHRKKTVKVQLILVTFKRLPLKQIDFCNASTLTKSISIKCGIHHTPEENQLKMTCNIPPQCKFIPIQAWINKTKSLVARLKNALQPQMDTTKTVRHFSKKFQKSSQLQQIKLHTRRDMGEYPRIDYHNSSWKDVQFSLKDLIFQF